MKSPRDHALGLLAKAEHDLVAARATLAPQIIALEEQILRLSPFAVEARYDDELAPSLSEAREALQIATEVYDLIAQIVQHDKPADIA